jgi:hypothetical protein
MIGRAFFSNKQFDEALLYFGDSIFYILVTEPCFNGSDECSLGASLTDRSFDCMKKIYFKKVYLAKLINLNSFFLTYGKRK